MYLWVPFLRLPKPFYLVYWHTTQVALLAVMFIGQVLKEELRLSNFSVVFSVKTCYYASIQEKYMTYKIMAYVVYIYVYFL